MDEQQTSPFLFCDRTSSGSMLGLFCPETDVQNGTPLWCFSRRLERRHVSHSDPSWGRLPRPRVMKRRFCSALHAVKSCRGGREGHAMRVPRPTGGFPSPGTFLSRARGSRRPLDNGCGDPRSDSGVLEGCHQWTDRPPGPKRSCESEDQDPHLKIILGGLRSRSLC
jgi:hypothetical protein